MDDRRMFDYGQLHTSAFFERKCNFRLAFMYYKSFLFPLIRVDTLSHTVLCLCQWTIETECICYNGT